MSTNLTLPKQSNLPMLLSPTSERVSREILESGTTKNKFLPREYIYRSSVIVIDIDSNPSNKYQYCTAFDTLKERPIMLRSITIA